MERHPGTRPHLHATHVGAAGHFPALHHLGATSNLTALLDHDLDFRLGGGGRGHIRPALTLSAAHFLGCLALSWAS